MHGAAASNRYITVTVQPLPAEDTSQKQLIDITFSLLSKCLQVRDTLTDESVPWEDRLRHLPSWVRVGDDPVQGTKHGVLSSLPHRRVVGDERPEEGNWSLIVSGTVMGYRRIIGVVNSEGGDVRLDSAECEMLSRYFFYCASPTATAAADLALEHGVSVADFQERVETLWDTGILDAPELLKQMYTTELDDLLIDALSTYVRENVNKTTGDIT